MRTIIFLFISMVSAFVLDAVLGYITKGIIPPLIVIVIFYWFWRLEIGYRILLGVAVGAVLDTIGFLPVGTYTFMLVCVAFLCEPMKTFFSNTGSRMVIVFNIVLFTIAFRLLVVPASFFITFVSRVL